MYLKKLTLNNIGVYYSTHSIDFTTTENKNVILIGGKNGAGKTTILECIQIALYGPIAFGYKTENESYKNKIFSMLNKKAIEAQDPLFQMFLEFEYVEDYQKHNLVFRRQWEPQIKNKGVKELFTIEHNGQLIENPQQLDMIQTKINEAFPPKLLKFCFFDGETISSVITDNLISDYLREVANTVFNLDLFKHLNRDLENYHNHLISQYNPELSRIIADLKTEMEDKLKLREKVLQDLSNAKQELTESQNEVNYLKDQFHIYGGVMQSKREELIKNINQIEQKRNEINDEIKTFITTLFPFVIVKNELLDIQKQIEREQQLEIHSFLEENITLNELSSILSNLGIEKISSELAESLKSSLLDLISSENIKPIHRASFSQRSGLEALLSTIQNSRPEHIITLFNESDELLSAMQTLRQQLHTNDSNTELKTMTEQIEQLTKKIFKLETLIEEHTKDLENVDQWLEDRSKEIAHLEKEAKELAKTDRASNYIQAIIKVSNQFVDIELKSKLKRVEEEVIYMLNLLLQKDNFIHDISISSTDFEIKLFTAQHAEIDKLTLSAGEKHLLLLSLIWAVVKVSKRRVPFVLDTLLGRLDQNHKFNVLTKLIPQYERQVVILSTDTEIDQQHFELIQPFISKVATIVSNGQQSHVQYNTYFKYVEKVGDLTEIST